MLSRNVLVLNQNYEPLSITKAKRAVVLIYLGKAELVERYDGIKVRSVYSTIPLPSVVRLVFFVRVHRRAITVSRKNIMKRDGYTCQYCDMSEGAMTTDHVIPRRLGGKDTWENLVCACTKCNNRKGDRSPNEAGLTLIRHPKKPHFFTFINSLITVPDVRWKRYLFLDS
ncbi:HNH endonuclease [candidate division TA06 bacterium]|uniref:HNH endonuclease n=1 Tax=candidate division TA06 bacterium TaxID=2250710 RepID=A0A523UV42_UNCT6|nr:MAG: HNH endonuclease [candidate division TA06 bacterium]